MESLSNATVMHDAPSSRNEPRKNKKWVIFYRKPSFLAKIGVMAFFQKVSLGTVAIVAICMVDMFLTLVAVLAGKAIEANPVLSWSFDYGPMAFALAKVASFIPGVWALEMCRLHNARFAGLASRAVVYGYMAVYLIGSLKLHGMM